MRRRSTDELKHIWQLNYVNVPPPRTEKPKGDLEMLSEKLIELKVVEHIRATSVGRLIKKMN